MTEASQIRAWMRKVMEAKGWSAEEWARKAETTPTNITRFLKGAKHIPSVRTISKLSSVAGSTPAIGRPLVSVAPRILPVYARVPLKGQSNKVAGSIQIMGQASDQAFAFAVGSVQAENMTMHGIGEGDILVCEPPETLPPTDQSLVVFLTDEHDAATARLGWVQGDTIVRPTSTGLATFARSDVLIAGIALEVRRILRPGYAPDIAGADGQSGA